MNNTSQTVPNGVQLDVAGDYVWDESVVDDSGASRYFAVDATSLLHCEQCKENGHSTRDCPHMRCLGCGALDEHETKDCHVRKTCRKCGEKGHLQADCRKGWRLGEKCETCERTTHVTKQCPEIWRGYLYVDRQTRLKAPIRWCYNCADSGHYGDDCPSPRGHPLRLHEPSVFSETVASQGPCKLRHRDDRPSFGRRQNHLPAKPDTLGGRGGLDARSFNSLAQAEPSGSHHYLKSVSRRKTNAFDDRIGELNETDDWFSNPSSHANTPGSKGLRVGPRAPMGSRIDSDHLSSRVHPYPANHHHSHSDDSRALHAGGKAKIFAARLGQASLPGPQYQGGYT